MLYVVIAATYLAFCVMTRKEFMLKLAYTVTDYKLELGRFEDVLRRSLLVLEEVAVAIK